MVPTVLLRFVSYAPLLVGEWKGRCVCACVYENTRFSLLSFVADKKSSLSFPSFPTTRTPENFLVLCNPKRPSFDLATS